MIYEQEEVFSNYQNDEITPQEGLLGAVRDLKRMYKKELKRIKKTKQLKQLSQSELREQTQKIFYYYEQLLEQKEKCKQNEQSDLNDQVILSVEKTQKQNYLIKTQKGKHYLCQCHQMAFLTNQELGGHLRTPK
ncbi:unnamed protein product [Paramecium pentaurelia]|uniref:Uncharacterized protein n=1 Tax=Paramecium pentaurelia TaxID=43138 RepID=A0A8S1T5H5_9CILI|nr:unnamed protein product [Paramecium pentaurelia]